MLSFQVLPVILVWLQRLCIWVCCLLLFILVYFGPGWLRDLGLRIHLFKNITWKTWMLQICCHEPVRSHLEVYSEINLWKNVREIHVNSKAVIGIHDGYNKLGKTPLEYREYHDFTGQGHAKKGTPSSCWAQSTCIPDRPGISRMYSRDHQHGHFWGIELEAKMYVW